MQKLTRYFQSTHVSILLVGLKKCLFFPLLVTYDFQLSIPAYTYKYFLLKLGTYCLCIFSNQITYVMHELLKLQKPSILKEEFSVKSTQFFFLNKEEFRGFLIAFKR